MEDRSVLFATDCYVPPVPVSQNDIHVSEDPCSKIVRQYVLPDLATTRLLLSPTFLPYLALMVGFSVLATAAILELLLRLVFVGCTLGVHYFTASQDLPKPYNLSNELVRIRYM